MLKYPVTTQLVSTFTSTAGLPCVAVQPQASASYVQSLCAGSVYQAATLLRPAKSATPAAATSGTPGQLVRDVQVYPNPALDEATVSFRSEEAGQVAAYLTDLVGKRVKFIAEGQTAQGTHTVKFRTADLTAGIYPCVVEHADGRRAAIRLLVIRWFRLFYFNLYQRRHPNLDGAAGAFFIISHETAVSYRVLASIAAPD